MGDQKKLLLNKFGVNQHWSDLYRKNGRYKKMFFFKLLLFQEIFQFLFLNTFFSNFSFRSFDIKKYFFKNKTNLSLNNFLKKKSLKKKQGVYLSRVNTLGYHNSIVLILFLYSPQKKKRTRKKFRIFSNKLLFKQIISLFSFK
jgi:hypothetical protein